MPWEPTDDADPDDDPVGADHLLDPDGAAPICSCGVTALPDGSGGFTCDNPDCEAFGEVLG